MHQQVAQCPVFNLLLSKKSRQDLDRVCPQFQHDFGPWLEAIPLDNWQRNLQSFCPNDLMNEFHVSTHLRKNSFDVSGICLRVNDYAPTARLTNISINSVR